MATLWITEMNTLSISHTGLAQVARIPAVAEQTVTITGTSAQSSALNADTRLVRLQSDTACHIAIGASPTATTSNMRLSAGVPEYFGVPGGQKLAVIQGS